MTALAGAVAVTAAVVDVKQRRIPNWLTYSSMIAGIVLQSVFHGLTGLLSAIEGCLLFGGIFMLFYLVRAMGAGDVKLAARMPGRTERLVSSNVRDGDRRWSISDHHHGV